MRWLRSGRPGAFACVAFAWAVLLTAACVADETQLLEPAPLQGLPELPELLIDPAGGSRRAGTVFVGDDPFDVGSDGARGAALLGATTSGNTTAVHWAEVGDGTTVWLALSSLAGRDESGASRWTVEQTFTIRAGPGRFVAIGTTICRALRESAPDPDQMLVSAVDRQSFEVVAAWLVGQRGVDDVERPDDVRCAPVD